MNFIRHFGLITKNIEITSNILIWFGFICYYDNVEMDRGRIRKFKNHNMLIDIELIQLIDKKYFTDNVPNSIFHICFNMIPPIFTKMFGTLVEEKAADPNVKLWFWYIDDFLYFEFYQLKYENKEIKI